MTSSSPSDRLRPLADAIGLTGSVLCALHCLIVPLSLLFGQVGALSLVEDEFFHRLLLFFVVPAAIVAFGVGCRQHKDRLVLVLGVAGLVLLTLALTVLHDFLGETGERWTAILASGLLISAHVRNFRLCRAGVCEHDAVAAEAG